MALIKSLDSSFGVPVEYHRITAVNINSKSRVITICVASYLSKEARSQKSIPLEEIDIEVPRQDYQLFMKTDVIQAAYEWLVENVVGFEDAEDCFVKMEEIINPPITEENEGSESEA